MKEIEQTILAPPDGNCFMACVASILEIPLDAVPHVTAEEGKDTDGWRRYFDRLNAGFLRDRNLWVQILGTSSEAGPWKPRGWAILGAKSPRGDWLHAVVCRDGEIVWDPHPGRDAGVGEWRDWTVFIVLDPSKPIGLGA